MSIQVSKVYIELQNIQDSKKIMLIWPEEVSVLFGFYITK